MMAAMQVEVEAKKHSTGWVGGSGSGVKGTNSGAGAAEGAACGRDALGPMTMDSWAMLLAYGGHVMLKSSLDLAQGLCGSGWDGMAPCHPVLMLRDAGRSGRLSYGPYDARAGQSGGGGASAGGGRGGGGGGCRAAAAGAGAGSTYAEGAE